MSETPDHGTEAEEIRASFGTSRRATNFTWDQLYRVPASRDSWVLRTAPGIVIVEGAPDLIERPVSRIDSHNECIV